nr:hypothetical protein [uncultured Mediterranean phage uvMED]
MATLTNTQISVTYVGLLKTSANTVLTSTAQQITDGSGNNSILYLSTAGVGIGGSPASGKELDVTGNVQVTGDLIVDNITIDGSTITNASGNLTIVNTVDDGDIIFQSDDGSGGLTTYLAIDGGDEVIRFYKSAYITDNIKALFGNSSDLQIYHDGTDSIIEQTQTGSGDLILRNGNDDKDIVFQSDDASGGVTTYFKLDGSAGFTVVSKKFRFEDNVNLTLGTADDLSLFHDGTDSTIKNDTGDLIIKNNADDKDIIFQSDDGSGGTTEYFRLDGSAETNVFSKNITLAGSHTITNDSNGHLNINSASGKQIFIDAQGQLRLDSGGAQALTLDSSQDATFTGNINLADSKKVSLGASDDFNMSHNGTDTTIQNITGHLNIINKSNDKDIFIENDDGSGGTTTYLMADGSEGALKLFHYGSKKFETTAGGVVITGTIDSSGTIVSTGGNIRVGSDTGKFLAGASNDLQIYHDGSNSYIQNDVGNLVIEQFADDSDIVFKADDGSGGTVEYIIIDGSASRVQYGVDLQMLDNKKIQVGTGNDLEIYHNGSNSFISDTGTGLLVISTNHLQVYNAGISEFMITATEDGSVDLYHNGNKKFETTSTGATVTGDILVDGGNITLGTDSVAGNVLTPSDVLAFTVDSNANTSGTPNIQFKVGSSEKMRITSAGRLGLGTTSPSSLLHLESASSPTLRLVDTTNSVTLLAFAQDTNTGFGNFSNHPLIFYTNSTTALTLDTSQNTTFAGNVSLADSKILRIGSGNDLDLLHDGTNTQISNNTGDLQIINNADDKDIAFFSDDGSGGTTEYFRLDGSTEANVFTKNIVIGSSSADGKLDITQSSATEPVIRLTDDGVCNYDFIFPDSDTIKLETSTSSNKTFKLLNAGSGNMNLEVSGSLSKGSGSFRIDHPVKPDTHYLYHSFVESPLTDLIYRGKTKLTKGKASINIDKHFGMTEGTFSALVDDKQVFTTNEDTWDPVRGKIEGNELHIECQNEDFDGYVSWLVIGDRKDKHIMEVDWTDDKGKPILEIQK